MPTHVKSGVLRTNHAIRKLVTKFEEYKKDENKDIWIPETKMLKILMKKFPNKEIIPESVKQFLYEEKDGSKNQRIGVSYSFHPMNPEFMKLMGRNGCHRTMRR